MPTKSNKRGGDRESTQGPRRNKKKSQLKMNNAINEIKNTLDGTNSRITEAEDLSPKPENTRELLTTGNIK